MKKSDAIFELEAIKANLVGEYATEASENRAKHIKKKIDAIDLAILFLKEKWLGGAE